ncbi:efflux RND transporter periplasmic adaptor subunit [Chitinophaga sp. GCM10012297]|uniref:Efflux RND transporter periplasmic adaptor subunit n=1 Tax=Chitinophaga chungangae TaxID=2821488 RepID=A0ABS3YBB5_9BACT|nr:efflux RND transporter periplasmic adaptor subunit [Chitinophaga chungangae]MBO9151954.1 efflux RND transporter periplasmic adaptor subunit [Chitinophaga chungangae]
MQKLLIIFAAAALVSCGNSPTLNGKDSTGTNETHADEHGHGEETVELTEAQARTVGLQTAAIENRSLSGAIKVNGMLDVPPQQMLSVSTPFGGILRNTQLLEGYWVKKGQVIAEMEHPDYIQLQQDYLEAKAQFGFLEQELERQQELSKENVTARKTLQKTEAEHRALKVRIEGLRQKLLLMNIHVATLEKGTIVRAIPVLAPISGYVTKVNANIGKFVSANESMFEIVDTEHLHAELTVFEKDIPRLKIGRKVRFVLSNETKERTATVHLIGREIDSDRTIRVHCHLDKEDKEMMPGTYLKAWVETGAMEVPSLPDEAIVMEGGKYYVFLAQEEPHHFKRLEISTGVSGNGYTEVRLPEETPAGAKFAVKGAGDLMAAMMNAGEAGHAH